jgi:pimeloyl-ACP methyl ester carboxylesterase
VHAFWGEHEMADRAMLDARMALLRQARPDVEIEVIPQAGHWAFYEAAGRFNAALLRILTL